MVEIGLVQLTGACQLPVNDKLMSPLSFSLWVPGKVWHKCSSLTAQQCSSASAWTSYSIYVPMLSYKYGCFEVLFGAISPQSFLSTCPNTGQNIQTTVCSEATRIQFSTSHSTKRRAALSCVNITPEKWPGNPTWHQPSLGQNIPGQDLLTSNLSVTQSLWAVLQPNTRGRRLSIL